MLQVHGIAAFDDNYIWAIQGENGKVAIVDPGDADPVLSYLQKTGQQAVAILITHKHYDHVGQPGGKKRDNTENIKSMDTG